MCSKIVLVQFVALFIIGLCHRSVGEGKFEMISITVGSSFLQHGDLNYLCIHKLIQNLKVLLKFTKHNDVSKN